MQSLTQTIYRLRVRRSEIARARDEATGEWRDELDREVISLSNQIRKLEAKDNDMSYKPEVETRCMEQ